MGEEPKTAVERYACIICKRPPTGRVEVYYAGKPLDPRFDLRNHSPDGFEWGYGGSGPAQLALAILAAVTGDDEIAQRHYQRFKFEVVGAMPKAGDAITAKEVVDWVAKKEAERVLTDESDV